MKKKLLFVVFLIVFVSYAIAATVEGQNSYLDGKIYIPLIGNGILGSQPSGFARVGQTVSPGNYQGSVSFYIKIDLSSALAAGYVLEDNPDIAITFHDLDFKTISSHDRTYNESVSILLVENSPMNVENPAGGVLVQTNEPYLNIDGSNYTKYNTGKVTTNNTTLVYNLRFSDFTENGKSIQNIRDNINQDKEFALYITLRQTAQCNINCSNSPESIEFSNFVFNTIPIPVVPTCSLSTNYNSGKIPLNTTITLTAHDIGEGLHSFNIDLGDGTHSACSITGSIGTCNIFHTYNSIGFFTVNSSLFSPEITCVPTTISTTPVSPVCGLSNFSFETATESLVKIKTLVGEDITGYSFTVYDAINQKITAVQSGVSFSSFNPALVQNHNYKIVATKKNCTAIQNYFLVTSTPTVSVPETTPVIIIALLVLVLIVLSNKNKAKK